MLLLRYTRAEALLAAGGLREEGAASKASKKKGLNGEDIADSGLVQGHAYSILNAVELSTLPGLNLGGALGATKLVQLRNPWGSFEWQGAWSDGSEEWRANPSIRLQLRPTSGDDGSFWMSWEDFSAIFEMIDICDRSTTFDLRLDVHEDYGSCGVVWGCLAGGCQYVLCCSGIRTIY